jgi:hypothetical protein
MATGQVNYSIEMAATASSRRTSAVTPAGARPRGGYDLRTTTVGGDEFGSEQRKVGSWIY